MTSTGGKIKTSGLSHIAIRVNDLDRSIKFYTELFNIGLTRKGEDMAFLNTPGTPDSFAFFRSDQKISHACDLHHFGFFVSEEDFKKALDYIDKNSINILEGPGAWSDGTKYVYIEDPDGYRVQISTG
ncbi:VOC family protein [Methanooceanicella nereidis]|uniref:VOC family protein n=1 Tax=Methanooceanicella nereidis TaxID=2052831 RepID=UPI001E30E0E7|nr:VOC family protein [Methanocella sp. CWC-04]